MLKSYRTLPEAWVMSLCDFRRSLNFFRFAAKKQNCDPISRTREVELELGILVRRILWVSPGSSNFVVGF